MRRGWREAALVVVEAAVLGGVAVALFGFFGHPISGWATLGVAGVLVVAGHAQGRLRERTEMQPARWVEERTDRPFVRMTELGQQLQWGLDSPERWSRVLQPQLASLAADRLRRHRGVDWRRHPDRAHQLMGDELWAALADPAAPVPTLRQVAQLVGRIEQL